MKLHFFNWRLILCTFILLCICAFLYTLPPGTPTAGADETVASPSGAHPDEDTGVAVAVARDRAKLMHDIYAATLDVMHERYFHGARAIVPARAMEDVFAEIKRQSKVEAHWIAVNMKAMSINHEPKSEFEKRAAKEIAAGKTALEVVEDGYYRRAGAIPLANNCISCHDGFFKEPSKTPRFAGLVISIPVAVEADKGE